MTARRAWLILLLTPAEMMLGLSQSFSMAMQRDLELHRFPRPDRLQGRRVLCGICAMLCFAGTALLAEDAEPDTDLARVTGTVVDSEGRPVTDAEVRVIDANIGPVRTDASGRFSLQLDQCTTESCLVARDAAGERMSLWETRRDGVTLVPQTAEARFVLRPCVTVKVRVVDAKNAPVPDATVVALHSRWMPVASMRTDATGTAAIRIPDNADLSHLLALKSGVGFDYMENFSKSPLPLADPPPAEAKLILTGAHKVQVKVVGSDGRAVQGVELYPSWLKLPGRKQSLSLSYAARAGGLLRSTDASGTAVFDFLSDVATSVSFGAKSTAPEFYRQHDSPSWSSSRGTIMPSEFTTLVLPSQTLSGSVLLPDGKPAAGILVKVQGFGSGASLSLRARTRRDGTFKLCAAAERSYLLSVVDDQWAASSLKGVVLREGQDRKDLRFQLIPGTLVTGTLTFRAGGKPSAHALVTIYEYGASIDPSILPGLGSRSESLTRWVETDAQGRFSVRLGPGSYRFHPYDSGGRTLEIGDQPAMELNLFSKEAP